jgi:hypothetical protein
MNIFFLDSDLTKCAQYHVDRHCVKIILESCQVLCTAYPNGTAPYKHTHKNHPIAVWCRLNKANFNYVVRYAKELCKEYTYRYGKKHKCEEVLAWIDSNAPSIPEGDQTEPPRCFGEFKSSIRTTNSVVTDYREYYRLGKSHLFSWTGRAKPDWITACLLSNLKN